MQTRLYRVALIVLNAAGAALVAVAQWGPGIGLSPEAIALITMLGNGLIVLLRQIGDPSTPTRPAP
jgi:hypothetical protein